MATNTTIPGSQNIAGKKLGVSAEEIEQAVAKKHSHHNQSILDQIDHVPGNTGDSKWTKTAVDAFENLLKNYLVYSRDDAQSVVDELIAMLGGSAELTNISVSYKGGNKFVGDTLAFSDFELVARYSDNTTEIVSDGYEIRPSTLTSTQNLITISYNGKTVQATVNAYDVEPTSVTILSGPTSIYNGDSYRYQNGWNLMVSFNNGTSIDNYDVNTVDFEPEIAEIGVNEVTIRITGTDITAKRTVTVIEKPLDQYQVSIVNDDGLTWAITANGQPVSDGAYITYGTQLSYAFTLSDHYHTTNETSYEMGGQTHGITSAGTVNVTSDITFNAATALNNYLITIYTSDGASLNVQNVGNSSAVHSGDMLPYGTQLKLTKSVGDGYVQNTYVYWFDNGSHTNITDNPATILVHGQTTIRLEASPLPTDFTYTWESAIVNGHGNGDKQAGVYTANLGQSGGYTDAMTIYDGNTKITNLTNDQLNYVHISLNPQPSTGIKAPSDVIIKKVNGSWVCTRFNVNSTNNGVKLSYVTTTPNFYIEGGKLYATTFGGYTQGATFYGVNLSSNFIGVNAFKITISSDPNSNA